MLLLGADVHGNTLGILGLGRIGPAVARRARGFDLRLLHHDAIRDHAASASWGWCTRRRTPSCERPTS
jgi:lactate dehydrogenase-like 2-hydroxyacid dehydrogenase